MRIIGGIREILGLDKSDNGYELALTLDGQDCFVWKIHDEGKVVELQGFNRHVKNLSKGARVLIKDPRNNSETRYKIQGEVTTYPETDLWYMTCKFDPRK